MSTAPPSPALAAEVLAPPFQVVEYGWGEFEVNIAIYAKGVAEPLTVAHRLRLYPVGVPQSVDRPVVDEVYDELVFNSPPSDPVLRKALEAGTRSRQA